MPLSTDNKRLAVNRLLQEVSNLKTQCITGIDAMQKGPISANAVFSLIQRLTLLRQTVFAPALEDDGMLRLLAVDLGDSIPDTQQQLQKLLAAFAAVITASVAIFPVSDTQPAYILKDSIGQDGTITVRQFGPDQTADLRVALTAITDAIS